MKGSLPAAGVGVHPWKLICSGASKREDWDLEAATGLTEGLSPAAGGNHLARKYIRRYISHKQPFILMSHTGEQNETVDAVCVSVSPESLPVCLVLCMCAYVYYTPVFVCVPTGNTHSA